MNPTKWIDEWSILGLTDEHRTSLKAAMWKADGKFWGSPDTEDDATAAIKSAFDGIAKVLFDAGLLTEALLRDEIEALAWDSAIAAGWWRYASDTPARILPEQVGHYWVWRPPGRDWLGLFRAESSGWRAALFERQVKDPDTLSRIRGNPPAPNGLRTSPTETVTSTKTEEIARRAVKRQALVLPILADKGWKPGRLVTEAGVGKNSVYRYLDGTRAKITDENRKAIAEALGLTPETLPD